MLRGKDPGSAAQIGVLDIRVVEQILARVVQANLSGFQHVTPVCQVEGLVGVLLDEENRNAFLAKLVHQG